MKNFIKKLSFTLIYLVLFILLICQFILIIPNNIFDLDLSLLPSVYLTLGMTVLLILFFTFSLLKKIRSKRYIMLFLFLYFIILFFIKIATINNYFYDYEYYDIPYNPPYDPLYGGPPLTNISPSRFVSIPRDVNIYELIYYEVNYNDNQKP